MKYKGVLVSVLAKKKLARIFIIANAGTPYKKILKLKQLIEHFLYLKNHNQLDHLQFHLKQLLSQY